MRNSLMYLTRRCPYNCAYCGIVDNTKKRSDELTVLQWKSAFEILEQMGIQFNLVLGNEPWLLGEDLPEIINHSNIPSAVYTTCQHGLWNRYHESFFSEKGKGLNNLSIGVDTPMPTTSQFPSRDTDDSLKKSFNAWEAFAWIKVNAPWVETHATVTLHKENISALPKIIKDLDDMEIFSNINFIHWNKDGGYDFFGKTETLEHLLFTPKDMDSIRRTLEWVLDNQKLLQNPEMLEQPADRLVSMGWHCNGDPYGGPTIDADGSLRVCGYRKGIRTPKFSIFDLPEHEEEWQEAVYADAMDCPGCQWSCSWMFNHWNKENPEHGTEIFTNHKVTS